MTRSSEELKPIRPPFLFKQFLINSAGQIDGCKNYNSTYSAIDNNCRQYHYALILIAALIFNNVSGLSWLGYFLAKTLPAVLPETSCKIRHLNASLYPTFAIQHSILYMSFSSIKPPISILPTFYNKATKCCISA